MPIGKMLTDWLAPDRQALQDEDYVLKPMVPKTTLTQPGYFTERLWAPDRWGYTVVGVRLTNFRTIPPTVWLGRDPAPWCPKPWSKSKRAEFQRLVASASVKTEGTPHDRTKRGRT